MEIEQLVQKAMRQQGFSTIGEVVDAMRITRSTYSLWKNGKCVPTPEHAQRLAELAGIDPAPFVVDMLMQSTKDSGLRRTLERFKRAVAALFLLTLALPQATAEAIRQCILCSIRPVPVSLRTASRTW